MIADIGGYTEFLRDRRKSLMHAQAVVAALLEAVMGEAGPLEVAKLEGDAVFFHLPWPEGASQPPLADTVSDMQRGFALKKEEMISVGTCDCESCSQIRNLNIKFVSHAGDVVRQKIGVYRELAGVDIILVHRMLKNKVPVPEYLLGTSETLPLMGSAAGIINLDHNFEGLGPVATYFRDLSPEIPASVLPPLKASLAKKILARLMLELGAMLFRLGLAAPLAIKGISKESVVTPD